MSHEFMTWATFKYTKQHTNWLDTFSSFSLSPSLHGFHFAWTLKSSSLLFLDYEVDWMSFSLGSCTFPRLDGAVFEMEEAFGNWNTIWFFNSFINWFLMIWSEAMSSVLGILTFPTLDGSVCNCEQFLQLLNPLLTWELSTWGIVCFSEPDCSCLPFWPTDGSKGESTLARNWVYSI